jgi:type IV secretory pathway TrbF-like protein
MLLQRKAIIWSLIMQEPKKFSNWRFIGIGLIVIGVSVATAIWYTNTWSEVSLLAFPVIISFIGVGAIFLFDKEV